MKNKILATSPKPTKTKIKTMDFSEAVSEMLNNKKVHKLEWKDKAFYGFINNGILSLHKPDGNNYQWVLSDGDLSGADYIVI